MHQKAAPWYTFCWRKGMFIHHFTYWHTSRATLSRCRLLWDVRTVRLKCLCLTINFWEQIRVHVSSKDLTFASEAGEWYGLLYHQQLSPLLSIMKMCSWLYSGNFEANGVWSWKGRQSSILLQQLRNFNLVMIRLFWHNLWFSMIASIQCIQCFISNLSIV